MTLSKNISLGLAAEMKDYSIAVKAYNDTIGIAKGPHGILLSW